MVEMETSVIAKIFGVRAVFETIKGRPRQAISPILLFLEAPLQSVTQSHQLIHPSNNAVLFRQWWKEHGEKAQTLHAESLSRHTNLDIVDHFLKKRRDERHVYKFANSG